MSQRQLFAVSAHRDGFRRAGREWAVQPATVAVADADDPDRPAGAVTPAQLEQLRADPNIAVVPTVPDAGGDPVAESEGAARLVADLDAALAAARAAHLRTATALAPEAAERTGDGRLTVDWLAAATGLDGVTAAERDAAATA